MGRVCYEIFPSRVFVWSWFLLLCEMRRVLVPAVDERLSLPATLVIVICPRVVKHADTFPSKENVEGQFPTYSTHKSQFVADKQKSK